LFGVLLFSAVVVSFADAASFGSSERNDSDSEPSSGNHACPAACICLGNFVDCSEKGLVEIPSDLPEWVEEL
jgi:hypothetical protein